jgi:hypothetical protein
MNCEAIASAPPWNVSWNVPGTITEAVRRASHAELELNRVFPLFTTRTLDEPTSRELEAFALQLRVAHRAALQSLSFYRQRRTSPEAVAAAYESLAVLIEAFARRASFEAPELDDA